MNKLSLGGLVLLTALSCRPAQREERFYEMHGIAPPPSAIAEVEAILKKECIGKSLKVNQQMFHCEQSRTVSSNGGYQTFINSVNVAFSDIAKVGKEPYYAHLLFGSDVYLVLNDGKNVVIYMEDEEQAERFRKALVGSSYFASQTLLPEPPPPTEIKKEDLGETSPPQPLRVATPLEEISKSQKGKENTSGLAVEGGFGNAYQLPGVGLDYFIQNESFKMSVLGSIGSAPSTVEEDKSTLGWAIGGRVYFGGNHRGLVEFTYGTFGEIIGSETDKNKMSEGKQTIKGPSISGGYQYLSKEGFLFVLTAGVGQFTWEGPESPSGARAHGKSSLPVYNVGIGYKLQ